MAGSDDRELLLLRPALELALVVARAGADATPAVPPPRSLRPMLRHSRLAGHSLAVLRAALDRDEPFRQRVAVDADVEQLGALAHAWLTRAEGWEAQLADAIEARAAADGERAELREARQARRRLDEAESRRAVAEAEAARHRSALEELEGQLAAARRHRRVAEEELVAQAASLRSLTTAVGELEAALADAVTARKDLDAEMAELQTQLASVRAERDEATAAARRAIEAERRTRSSAGDRAREGTRVRTELGRAIADAAAAAAALGGALGRAGDVLDADGRAAVISPAAVAAPSPANGPTPAPGGRRAPSLRRPVPLPPAVFDDSLEAANHLVGVPSMVLGVDGYNVTFRGWPERSVAEQRQVLVDRLAALAARTGVEVRVCFDGAEDVEMVPPRGRARDAVRVAFSSAGTDADEDLIELVRQLPPERPVTVATNDRRVAGIVARAGANVISSDQLLALLGRDVDR